MNLFGNYDEECSGCTDSNACNYYASASVDDGSCDFETCSGCKDPEACNYDASATIDNGECDYSSCGCLLPSACNYNPSAQASAFEDCIWSCYSGCDADACNYSPLSGPNATIQSSLHGDPWAFGFEAVPIILAEVSEANYILPCATDDEWLLEWELRGLFPAPCFGEGYFGSCQCASEAQANGYYADFEVQICSNGSASWTSHGTGSETVTVNYPCTEFAFYEGGTGSNNITIYIPSGVQEFFLYNATGTNIYNVYYNSDSTSFSHYFATGSPTLNLFGNYDEECSGCTDSNACNYYASASVDDGSCAYNLCNFGGCTIEGACNFSPYARYNDGSCEFNIDNCGVCGGDGSSCVGCTEPGACNYQQAATINQGCEYETCAGCTNENATNYDSTATIEDGSCLYNQAAHDAEYDAGYEAGAAECPHCANPEDPADINNDGCVQLNDLLDLLSAYGNCSAEESPWQCGDPLEYQGYDYETVQIGEQCWFAENLRAENYRNGDEIDSNISSSEWPYTLLGSVAVYGESGECDNFENSCDPNISLDKYGRLYNWYCISGEHQLCPSGWAVPTEGDFDTLIQSGGGLEEAGGALKSVSGWYNAGNGSDDLGFNGKPGGIRDG